jgi:hypothetical protein
MPDPTTVTDVLPVAGPLLDPALLGAGASCVIARLIDIVHAPLVIMIDRAAPTPAATLPNAAVVDTQTLAVMPEWPTRIGLLFVTEPARDPTTVTDVLPVAGPLLDPALLGAGASCVHIALLVPIWLPTLNPTS